MSAFWLRCLGSWFIGLFSLTMVIEPQARITNKMFFLVDCSGSMTGEKLSGAIGQVIEIAGQETDDIKIACIAFSDTYKRWDGPPATGPNALPNWTDLPDENALVELRTWLTEACLNGNTPIRESLTRAMQEPMQDMSLVIVSDGYFDEEEEDVAALFATLQQKRVSDGLGEVVLVGIGINPSDAPEADDLRFLVNSVGGSGGYFTENVRITRYGPH